MLLLAVLGCAIGEPATGARIPPDPATVEAARALPATTEALLFFAPGSPAGDVVEAYFEALASASGGRLVARRLDQAVVPALAEELRVRDNGTVALRRGDRSETLQVGEGDRAERSLGELDARVRGMLAQVGLDGAAVLLVGGGGGERYDALAQALALLDLDVTPVARPITELPDARMIVVLAPALEPAEQEVIARWIVDGHAALVLVEPEAPLNAVLAPLGVVAGGGVLAHEQLYARMRGGTHDRLNVASDRVGSHEAVADLSRVAARAPVLLVGATELRALPERDVDALVRPAPGTWVDDGDGEREEGEPDARGALAIAVSGDAWRAVVVGDAAAFSDQVLPVAQGNQVLLMGVLSWLVGRAAIEPVPASDPIALPPPPEVAVEVTPRAPAPRRLTWTDGTQRVLVERRTDAAGAFTWVTVEGPTPRAFRGNEAADEVLASFAPLMALREIDPETAPDPGVFGLEASAERVELRGPGAAWTLAIGAETWGSRDVFVGRDGRVYLIDDAVIRPLRHAGVRFVARRLHPGRDLARITAIRGGHRAVLEPDEEGAWRRVDHPEAPSAEVESLTAWVTAVDRALGEPVAEPTGLVQVGVIELADPERTWRVELLEDPATGTIYARSEFLRATARLPGSVGREVVARFPGVVGG